MKSMGSAACVGGARPGGWGGGDGRWHRHRDRKRPGRARRDVLLWRRLRRLRPYRSDAVGEAARAARCACPRRALDDVRSIAGGEWLAARGG